MDLSFANPAGFWALLALAAVLGDPCFCNANRDGWSPARSFSSSRSIPSAHRAGGVDRIAPFPAALAATRCRRPARVAPGRGRAGCGGIPPSAWSSCSIVRSRCWPSTPNSGRRPARPAAVPRAHRRHENGLASPRNRPRAAHPLLRAANSPASSPRSDRWKPHLGTHDFALRRSTPPADSSRDAGIALFVTDRKHATCPMASKRSPSAIPWTIAGGSASTVDGDHWRALVQNHSASDAEPAPGIRNPAGSNGRREHRSRWPRDRFARSAGAFPAGQDRCELVLAARSSFPLDDRLPVVKPQPKRITMYGWRRGIGAWSHFHPSVLAGSVAKVRSRSVNPPAVANVRTGYLFVPPDKMPRATRLTRCSSRRLARS